MAHSTGPSKPPGSTRWPEWLQIPWVLDLVGDTTSFRILNCLLFVFIAMEIVLLRADSIEGVTELICSNTTQALSFPVMCFGFVPANVTAESSALADIASELVENILIGTFTIAPWIPVFFGITYMTNKKIAAAISVYICVMVVLHMSTAFNFWASFPACTSEYLAVAVLLMSTTDTAIKDSWEQSNGYTMAKVAAVAEILSAISLLLFCLAWFLMVLRLCADRAGAMRPFTDERRVAQDQHVRILFDPRYQRERRLDKLTRLRRIASIDMTAGPAPEESKHVTGSIGVRLKARLTLLVNGPARQPGEYRSTYFYYPTRLVFACVYVWLYLLVGLAAIGATVNKFLVVSDIFLEQAKAWVHGVVNISIVEDLPVLREFMPIDIADLMDQLVETMQAQVLSVVWRTLYATIALIVVLMLILWVVIFKSYKKKVLLLRQGKYWFDPRKFDVYKVVEYISVQTWSFYGFAFVTMFVTALLVLTCSLLASFEWLRDKLWHFVWVQAAHVLITAMFIRIFEYVFFRLICSEGGRTLKRRKLMSFGEAITLYAYLPLGLVQTAFRFGLALLFQYISFPLLFLSTCPREFEAFDAGHKAFIAMLLIDHEQNNAVVNVFIRQLWEPIEQARALKKSQQEQKQHDLGEQLLPLSVPMQEFGSESKQQSMHMTRLQARFRWHLAYTLIRNPALREARMNLSNLEELHFQSSKGDL